MAFSTQTRIEDKNGGKVRQTKIKRKQKGKRRKKLNEIQNSHTTILKKLTGLHFSMCSLANGLDVFMGLTTVDGMANFLQSYKMQHLGAESA